MQNDLISRSALIEDIDTQLKEIVDTDGITEDVILLISICEKFKNIVERIPIAYDVEKVVAELEEVKEKASVKNIIVSSYARGMMNRVIYIVRNGGKE